MVIKPGAGPPLIWRFVEEENERKEKEKKKVGREKRSPVHVLTPESLGIHQTDCSLGFASNQCLQMIAFPVNEHGLG